VKSQWGTQNLLHTHHDIKNGLTSQSQNRLHSDISIAKIFSRQLVKTRNNL